ncbi:MAG: formylglycine-generating enzyme family protein [Planctomycetes bacterium]|nr:formylglycine-generating enzyme family protein [Planctomycetota bacterium]
MGRKFVMEFSRLGMADRFHATNMGHRAAAVSRARAVIGILALMAFAGHGVAEDHPARLPLPESEAKSEAEMKAYAELIEHTTVKIEMLPIPGGRFTMGSPDGEPGRSADEGPRREVAVQPFWMGKFEITWDAYEIWMADIDIARRDLQKTPPNERDRLAEPFQISKPTEPYTDMTFGMGKRGYPAICMTQHSARTFCQWLSAKTGRYYRLPTEAEWEYACRAGTQTAFSFGDDPAQLGDYAWYYENSEEKYQKVGRKKANPWGLHDMHGNVAEWVLDQYVADFYALPGANDVQPLAIPATVYPRVVRGGGWDGEPDSLRSAARVGSSEDWSEQDPQEPKSIWYHTDALAVGFRIIRPLTEPSDPEKAEKWEKNLPVQVDIDEE